MQIIDGANSYLAVLCNWSPMSIKTNQLNIPATRVTTTQLKQPIYLTVMHVSACYQSVPL